MEDGMARWKSLICLLLVIAGPGAALGAQTPQAPKAQTAPVVAIRAGRLFDTQSGQLLTNEVVLVQGDRISMVGPANQVKIPAGTKVIDLSHALRWEMRSDKSMQASRW